MSWFNGFDARHHAVNGVGLFVRSGGRADGQALLLLHSFLQTHAIWHRVAQRLAERFFLLMPDLRGYGDSSQPPRSADPSKYGKRSMAADMMALMASLGRPRFALDIYERADMYERTDAFRESLPPLVSI